MDDVELVPAFDEASISPRPGLFFKTPHFRMSGFDKSTPETLTTACHAASGWRDLKNVGGASRLVYKMVNRLVGVILK